mmetsp:Transcript_47847/g.54201  ORF Transcript_47847/g.54201 Transcript_47847/m.54201 type:complete len:347 (-) Transcript_47847:41-1081(-)
MSNQQEQQDDDEKQSSSTNVDEDLKTGFWFREDVTPHLRTEAALTKMTFDCQSDFQHVKIIETIPFGKTLVLDGKSQSALSDEYVYHETLVHPAMLAHPDPKRVYIGGGGEFATAREVLKHPSVTEVIMVDIDKVVCDICRQEMPEWNQGVFEDPRLTVHYEDAHAFLKTYTGPAFDVIIMDIADPIEAGPGYVLYTEEFYQFALTKMTRDGVLVTQSGSGSIFNWSECFSAIHQTLRTAFDTVIPFTADIPSFGCNWGFNVAFNTTHSINDDENTHSSNRRTLMGIVEQSSANIDATIQRRIPHGKLKFYDGITHRGIFGVPKPIREGLAAETRTITVDNPVFMY